jgi:hypothetical protein
MATTNGARLRDRMEKFAILSGRGIFGISMSSSAQTLKEDTKEQVIAYFIFNWFE